MRNPGRIILLNDGRKVIEYNKQPIKGYIIWYLIDSRFNHIIGEDNKPKTLVNKFSVYQEFIKTVTLIGYVD